MRSTLALISTLLAASLPATAAERIGDPATDFAQLEASGGCGALRAAATNAAALESWSQDQLDKLYACSRAGPIPDGFLNGKVVIAPGGAFDRFGAFLEGLGVPKQGAVLKHFAQTLWQGKHFYKQDRGLLNKIGADVEPLLGQNIAGQMRFPAHLFCGQSLLDSRRESIIIDYAFTETVTIGGQRPYLDAIDWLAGGTTSTGKRGLKIRDEVRMVRPGLYLGRAYMDRVFVLNFILSANGQTDFGEDTCWPGTAAKGA